MAALVDCGSGLLLGGFSGYHASHAVPLFVGMPPVMPGIMAQCWLRQWIRGLCRLWRLCSSGGISWGVTLVFIAVTDQGQSSSCWAFSGTQAVYAVGAVFVWIPRASLSSCTPSTDTYIHGWISQDDSTAFRLHRYAWFFVDTCTASVYGGVRCNSYISNVKVDSDPAMLCSTVDTCSRQLGRIGRISFIFFVKSGFGS